MQIGIFGTGTVGNTIGTRLIGLGHHVMMGSRTATNEKALEWQQANGEHASNGTFADAAKFGEILFNCTAGTASLEVLQAAGTENLTGKIIIDISNPLDHSKGMPPTLSVSNTDSVGEILQREFPASKVVKTLNTMWCGLMVNPRMLPEDHHVFISGNDVDAKSSVKEILYSFGWKENEIIDLGDISTARGPEMYLPLWLRMWGALKVGAFNIKIIK